MVDPITRRFLVEAGVAPGMRVLDVGSGSGEVAFLAAAIVGERGSVTGVDRSTDAVTTATAAASSRGLSNVQFVLGDLTTVSFPESFDALIGRYVLQWLPDPAATLRALAAHIRPGGVIVFHEADWGGASSYPPAPLWDEACRRIAETIGRSGAETRGTALHGVFERAGLGAPTMRLDGVVGGGVDADPIDLNADIAGTLAAAAEELGIAAAADLEPDGLRSRLRAEVAATGSVLIARHEIGAWTTA